MGEPMSLKSEQIVCGLPFYSHAISILVQVPHKVASYYQNSRMYSYIPKLNALFEMGVNGFMSWNEVRVFIYTMSNINFINYKTLKRTTTRVLSVVHRQDNGRRSNFAGY